VKPSPVVFNSSSPWAARFRQSYLLGEGSGAPTDYQDAVPLNTAMGVTPGWVTGLDGLALRTNNDGLRYGDGTASLVGDNTQWPVYLASSFLLTAYNATSGYSSAIMVGSSTSTGGSYTQIYVRNPDGMIGINGSWGGTGFKSMGVVSPTAAPLNTVIHCLYVHFSLTSRAIYMKVGNNAAVKYSNADVLDSKDNAADAKRMLLGGNSRGGNTPIQYIAGDTYFAAVGYGGTVPTDNQCLDFVDNPYQLYVPQGGGAVGIGQSQLAIAT
jgi:hypothetical protein